MNFPYYLWMRRDVLLWLSAVSPFVDNFKWAQRFSKLFQPCLERYIRNKYVLLELTWFELCLFRTMCFLIFSDCYQQLMMRMKLIPVKPCLYQHGLNCVFFSGQCVSSSSATAISSWWWEWNWSQWNLACINLVWIVFSGPCVSSSSATPISS